MTMNIQELRAVAEAAEKATGSWRFRKPKGYSGWADDDLGLYGKWGYVIRPGDYGGMFNDLDAAEHVATFDPPTVLALLDRLERAER